MEGLQFVVDVVATRYNGRERALLLPSGVHCGCNPLRFNGQLSSSYRSRFPFQAMTCPAGTARTTPRSYLAQPSADPTMRCPGRPPASFCPSNPDKLSGFRRSCASLVVVTKTLLSSRPSTQRPRQCLFLHPTRCPFLPPQPACPKTSFHSPRPPTGGFGRRAGLRPMRRSWPG